MVTYTYESWLALQQKRRRRLDGKQRWLNIVKRDDELIQLSGASLEAIQHKARGILEQLSQELDQKTEQKKASREKKRQKKSSSSKTNVLSQLFEAYEATDDMLSRCAIAHLVKNGGKLSTTEEDPEKFDHRLRRKKEEIERLDAQLHARLPKGRDLTGEEFMEKLAIATQSIPENVVQQKDWQARLLTRPASLPYPIIYGSSVDIRWGKTAQNRLTVNFNGIDKCLKASDPAIKEWFKAVKEYPFRLYCDQRQLPFFQRFFEDWQVYQKQKDTYPAGLLTLSSAMLAWREGSGKGAPWDINHLVLYCSFDTRLMTEEGTRQIQQQKLAKTTKFVPTETEEHEFTESQQKFHQRSASTLTRLKNVPPRPSRKPYAGNPEILVGLSIGLSSPVTVAVVNGRTGKVLTYRTPQTLLGDRYHLFNRHRHQQRQNALKRHKNQTRGVTNQPSESELGEYVDRLLAKSIVELAQKYKAASIVIPTLTNLRELLAIV